MTERASRGARRYRTEKSARQQEAVCACMRAREHARAREREKRTFTFPKWNDRTNNHRSCAAGWTRREKRDASRTRRRQRPGGRAAAADLLWENFGASRLDLDGVGWLGERASEKIRGKAIRPRYIGTIRNRHCSPFHSRAACLNA